jgi:hypothetical protein
VVVDLPCWRERKRGSSNCIIERVAVDVLEYEAKTFEAAEEGGDVSVPG